MLRAVIRTALLASLATTPALAQTPSATGTSLIPSGQYQTLAWKDGAQFVYLLQPATRTPRRARLFVADVVDLGVRSRDDVLAEISATYGRAIASYDVAVEPAGSAADGAIAWVIRHRHVALAATVDDRGNLTLHVRGRANAEAGGGGAM